MGLLLPLFGRGIFHLIFCSGLQVSETSLSDEIPSPFGPRNAGESAALLSTAPATTITTVNTMIRFMELLSVFWIDRSVVLHSRHKMDVRTHPAIAAVLSLP